MSEIMIALSQFDNSSKNHNDVVDLISLSDKCLGIATDGEKEFLLIRVEEVISTLTQEEFSDKTLFANLLPEMLGPTRASAKVYWKFILGLHKEYGDITNFPSCYAILISSEHKEMVIINILFLMTAYDGKYMTNALSVFDRVYRMRNDRSGDYLFHRLLESCDVLGTLKERHSISESLETNCALLLVHIYNKQQESCLNYLKALFHIYLKKFPHETFPAPRALRIFMSQCSLSKNTKAMNAFADVVEARLKSDSMLLNLENLNNLLEHAASFFNNFQCFVEIMNDAVITRSLSVKLRINVLKHLSSFLDVCEVNSGEIRGTLGAVLSDAAMMDPSEAVRTCVLQLMAKSEVFLTSREILRVVLIKLRDENECVRRQAWAILEHVGMDRLSAALDRQALIHSANYLLQVLSNLCAYTFEVCRLIDV